MIRTLNVVCVCRNMESNEFSHIKWNHHILIIDETIVRSAPPAWEYLTEARSSDRQISFSLFPSFLMFCSSFDTIGNVSDPMDKLLLPNLKVDINVCSGLHFSENVCVCVKERKI